MDIFSKTSKLPTRTKSCNIDVILKLLLNKNLLSGYLSRNSKRFSWDFLFSFADAAVWRRNFLLDQSSVLYNAICQQRFEKINKKWIMFKKIWKHGDQTMVMMVWIMENKVIVPWSFHESWRQCQERLLPCRRNGMIMTKFRHDHGMIMTRSWHGRPIFPIR